MENIREGNIISDKDILSNVAKAVNRSISMLAKDMDEKRATLYQITTGRNNISVRIKAKILETYPTVNPDYIENGTEPIILKESKEGDDTFKEEVFMQLAKLNVKVDELNKKYGLLLKALTK